MMEITKNGMIFSGLLAPRTPNMPTMRSMTPLMIAPPPRKNSSPAPSASVSCSLSEAPLLAATPAKPPTQEARPSRMERMATMMTRIETTLMTF